MSYAQRIARNTIVQIIGRAVTTLTSLFMVGILNDGLRQEGWGGYVAVTTYIGLFAVLADMGVNLLYIRESSRYPEKSEQITAEFLGFRLFTAAVVLIMAPLVASFLPAYAPLRAAIWVAGIGQFFIIINQIFVSIFQVRLVMGRAVFTDALGRLVILVGVYLLFRQVQGGNMLEMVLWITALGNLINALLSYLLAKHFFRIRVAFAFKRWPSIFLQVLPMGSLAVLSLVHFKADSVILTLTQSTIDVGIYGNAYKVIEILIVLPGIFVGGLFPAMNQAILKKDPEFGNFVQKAFDLLVLAVVPLIAIIFALSPFVIGILTRENVAEASMVLRILCLAMVPWFLSSLMSHILLSLNQQRNLSILELVAVALNIALNLAIIPLYSYTGAAVTTVVTEVLSIIATTYMVTRALRFVPSLHVVRSSALALALISLLLFGLSSWLPLDSYLTAYTHQPRWLQLIETSLLMAALMGIYLLPFFLFKQFPPVLQERLNRFLKQAPV